MRQIILIAHDIRSTHNVGSLLRTGECMGIATMYMTGYTPYPPVENDERLPHISKKIGADIHKTALGAETLVAWQHKDNIQQLFSELRAKGYRIVGLEQDASSTPLHEWTPPDKIALLLGREVEGIDQSLLAACDEMVEIQQFGHKESLNVVQAAAMTLYHCRFAPLT